MGALPSGNAESPVETRRAVTEAPPEISVGNSVAATAPPDLPLAHTMHQHSDAAGEQRSAVLWALLQAEPRVFAGLRAA